MSDVDHDHSDDRLGEEAPVESIDVNKVSIRDLATPSSYIVYTDGASWYALRTDTQDIEFEDTDGIAVINNALARTAELSGSEGAGLVRVTAEPGGGYIESTTTLEHTHDGTGLLLESGVTVQYTGKNQAVLLGGENVYFEFDTIAAPKATRGIVDVGLRNGFVEGTEVRGPSESLWVSDAENRLAMASQDPSGTWIHIPRLNCTDGTDHGIVLTSASATKIEGYVWEVTVIGPDEVGITIGDRSAADSVRNNVFYAGVKGASNDATRLVEINDSRNGLYLERYTPATDGDWDVVIRESAEDCFVLPLTRRDDIRIKREAVVAADLGKFDPFRHEVLELNVEPDSLDGYEVIELDTAAVELQNGEVVHSTGPEAGSWANLRKRFHFDFGQLNFENPAVLRTEVTMTDDSGQEAWLVWGDREGPCVGWRIVDDRLEGFVHRGLGNGTRETVTLREGFGPGASWTLTAFYNPPTDVHYYVDESFAGTIDKHLPEGVVNSHRIATIDLTNTESADKSLGWSTWQLHQYPVGETAGGPLPGSAVSGGQSFSVSGERQAENSTLGAGETTAMSVTVEPTLDAVVRDTVPGGWTVLAADSDDVDYVEQGDDGDVFVYFTPKATANDRTTYTYEVEAPDDLTVMTSYEFGPGDVRPSSSETWVPVNDTSKTIIVE